MFKADVSKVSVKEYVAVQSLQNNDSIVNKVNFSSKVLKPFFSISIIFFAVGHLASLYIKSTLDPNKFIAVEFFKLFNLNSERGLATLFSTLLILSASGLLYFLYKVIDNTDKHRKYRWLALSFVFLFLCFDETFGVHEKFTGITKKVVGEDLTGILRWAWVIPYAIFLVGVTAYFFRFVLQLPKYIRNMFFLSGFIYVTGAMGMEMIEGYAGSHGLSLLNQVCILLEECMEIGGMALFVYTLVKYILSKTNQVLVTLK